LFSSQNYISYNEVNLANYAHACFDKAIAEIVSKANHVGKRDVL